MVVYGPEATMENEGLQKMAELLFKGEYPSAKICQALAAEGFFVLHSNPLYP